MRLMKTRRAMMSVFISSSSLSARLPALPVDVHERWLAPPRDPVLRDTGAFHL
jgi:hypothetical protein